MLPFGCFWGRKPCFCADSKVPKPRWVGHLSVPHSLPSHSLLWQQLITMFLGSSYTANCVSIAVLSLIAAAFGCAQYREVGASRAVLIFPGASRRLWVFHYPLTAASSLPPAHLSRGVYLRTEQLKPSWDDKLGFRLFWAGNRGLLGPCRWLQLESTQMSFLSKPQGCGRGESELQCTRKKTNNLLFFLYELFCFLTQQRVLLLSLQQTVSQVWMCSIQQHCTDLPRDAQCVKNRIWSAARVSLL